MRVHIHIPACLAGRLDAECTRLDRNRSYVVCKYIEAGLDAADMARSEHVPPGTVFFHTLGAGLCEIEVGALEDLSEGVGAPHVVQNYRYRVEGGEWLKRVARPGNLLHDYNERVQPPKATPEARAVLQALKDACDSISKVADAPEGADDDALYWGRLTWERAYEAACKAAGHDETGKPAGPARGK